MERNATVTRLLSDISKSKKPGKSMHLTEEVEGLFSSHILGHREIVATIIIATFLNPKFKASKNFYACNPRALYEGPIRDFFMKKGVPHMKSAPLNVAKNISKINEDWATNKRGKELALNVVKTVKAIEKMTKSELNDFAIYYFKRYLNEAQRIKKLSYTPEPDTNPFLIADLCIDLINDVPDGGSTPQFIVGSLIDAINTKHAGSSKVSGHLDRVSTTNTTSKKAGDVIEELPSGNVVYEITVKKFDLQRINDSYESLRADKQLKSNNEVIVICRPEDVYEKSKKFKSDTVIAGYEHNDVLYFFVDIYEFIKLNLVLLDTKTRKEFLTSITDYINQTNTAEKVKLYFRDWYKKH